MAISIDHLTYIITIPKADTTLVGTNAATGYEIRSYDEYALMRELADYLDSEAGIGLPNAFTHATQVTISGIVYARSLLFLAPYTVTFENGAYQVKLNGGTNNNLLDVLNPNTASVIPANSAGLQTVATGGGGSGATAAEVWAYASRTLTSTAAVLTTEQATQLAEIYRIHGLQLGFPLTVTATSRVSDGITQALSDDGTTVTVTRT